MKETAGDKPTDGGALPYTPVTLVMVRDPFTSAESRELSEALVALVEAGKNEEAHRLADPHASAEEQRAALAGFYLREQTGRRGARLILRWLRQDETRSDDKPVFVARAARAIETWAQFRLLRHGRALVLAKEAIAALNDLGDVKPDADLRDEARVWGQTLEAIRRCALRRGNLRQALNFHAVAEELGRKHPGCLPEEQRARRAMTAVAFLLEVHAEQGLPASLARYLARSLGHSEGDSPTAYAELAGDLSLTPDHLDAGLAVAARFGFADQVSARLEGLRERLFHGNWKLRRTAQRGAVLMAFVLLAVVVLLGFTLLVHFVSR